MQPVEPILTIDLFPGLSAELLRLLRALPPHAWDKPTACSGWSVKDVVAHLMGGNLGRLSFGRDRLARRPTTARPETYADLLALIDRQNAQWVAAARSISAPLLIDFLDVTEPQLYAHFKALPPFAIGGPGVAWAGENESARWFDIAREYTEKWLHQQHIREAVGQPLLTGRAWLFPVLDTFIRALPYAYRDVAAADGVAVLVHITGEAGGDWSLRRRSGAWQLFSGAPAEAVTTVRLADDLAWRLFSRGVAPAAVRPRIYVQGNGNLGWKILDVVSIMA